MRPWLLTSCVPAWLNWGSGEMSILIQQAWGPHFQDVPRCCCYCWPTETARTNEDSDKVPFELLPWHLQIYFSPQHPPNTALICQACSHCPLQPLVPHYPSSVASINQPLAACSIPGESGPLSHIKYWCLLFELCCILWISNWSRSSERKILEQGWGLFMAWASSS